MFIKVILYREKCKGIKKCGKCLNLCPVDIIVENKGRIKINKANEDECTLCNLCIKYCPTRAIQIEKLYLK